MVLSKKNVSNFKLREGMPSMLKVTLRGKGELEGNFIKQQQVKITMTIRQFLCWATGRSI